MFDEDLEDFKFVCIEPDLVAVQAFVYWDHILVIVRTGPHLSLAVGTSDFGRFVGMYLFPENWIEQKAFFKILGLGFQEIGKIDLFSCDDPFHKSGIDQFSPTVRAYFHGNALIIILSKLNMAPRTVVFFGAFPALFLSPFFEGILDLWKF